MNTHEEYMVRVQHLIAQYNSDLFSSGKTMELIQKEMGHYVDALRVDKEKQ